LSLVALGRRRRALQDRPAVPAGAPRAPARPAEDLGGRIRSMFSGREPAEAEWSRLEELLVLADVGPSTAARIAGDVRARWTPGADPARLLAEDVAEMLGGEDASLRLASDRLSVVLVVRVNGSGKTTTIGKLENLIGGEGR